MSTTLAFRLILGLVVGGVLTFSVWDRSYTELEERPADEDTRTGMPRFRSFAAVETLPTMLVMYLVISLAIGGREMAVQYLLGLLLRVFLLIGVYYVLLLAVLPLLRRHISARVCAVLWLLPGYLYFLAQVSSVQRADPGGERMLVLHASGTLVTVLLAVWACRPPATRRDIGEKLAARGWAPATVLNFLYRLEKKGWVKSGKDQNRNTYTPTVTRRAYGVAAMRERLDTVFGGDLAEAVRALVSESGCGQSELEQAMAVLAEKHAEAEEYDLYDPYG